MQSIEITNEQDKKIAKENNIYVKPPVPLWNWECPICLQEYFDTLYTAHLKYRQCRNCGEKLVLDIPNRQQI